MRCFYTQERALRQQRRQAITAARIVETWAASTAVSATDTIGGSRIFFLGGGDFGNPSERSQRALRRSELEEGHKKTSK